MDTIKIESTDQRTQGDFVVINRADFDSVKHEPFDDEARAALAGAVASGERVPTMPELLAARDQLMERERELADEKVRVAEQARANEIEAQRLRDEATKAQADQAAAAATVTADTKPAKAKAA